MNKNLSKEQILNLSDEQFIDWCCLVCKEINKNIFINNPKLIHIFRQIIDKNYKIYYTKIMKQHEYDIFKIMSEKGIAPLIIDVKKNNAVMKVKMMKYPITLTDYYDKYQNIDKYKNKIKDLIEKIHKENIIHGDLHSNNIVINPENDEVKIIDFGRSYYINNITPKIIIDLNKFLDPDKKFKNIQDIKNFEYIMYLRDF